MTFAARPTKILMTADTIGGVWTYALDLARALAPRDIEIALATLGRPLSRDQYAEASAIPNLRIYPSEYRLEWMDDPWDDIRDSRRWLRELADSFRPDLIHLNSFGCAAGDYPAPTLVVAHSCVLSWWQAVKREPAPAHWDRYARTVRSTLREADLVVAPTHAMMSELHRLYGPLARLRAILNGRNPAPFHRATKAPFILSAGRLWDEAKNIAALERIAPTLPWPVFVAGDSADPDGRRRASANLKLLGRLSTAELADQLAHAAIYALPARYEPFGLSAVEAALSGCALVLGDIPTLREVWSSAALYVNPDDPHELAIVLEELITRPTLRAALAARAGARAAAYSLARMGRAYMAAYSDLLAQSLAPIAEPQPIIWIPAQPN